ncbi:MAG: hypothetical protein GVY29_00645 [Spirochaetes bacterium]|jgi:DNA-nicking Smr family endonuclease|nr:hypothetical protein [Spirochaetota bacterium]
MSGSSFGDILSQWDRQQQKQSSKRPRAHRALEESLNEDPPPVNLDPERDGAGRSSSRGAGSGSVAPKNLPIQDTLDLHGMTRAEAEARTESFIQDASHRGLGKVLVIYGKGLHSRDGAVLRSSIHRMLQDHPLTGAMGTPDRRDGGSGAVWVVIRQRSR